MPCYIRMKRSFLQGLLWLYLYGFGFMALSLEPGFLDFDNLPDTNFSCVGKVIGGYYADLETNCQMFHVCTIGQLDEPMDIRFLCLNGTVFDQETRVCERIDEVDCTKSEQFYSLNLELYGHSQFSNLEENSETEQPLIIKSTLPTTTTTTTPPPPRKTTHVPFYTSVTPPTVTTLENRLSPGNHNHQNRHNHNIKGNNHVSSTPAHVSSGSNHHHISSHHFPVINPSATDIRFNPEEINISLHPGAPPDIRTKTVSFYSDNNSENQLVVTTHRAVFDKSPRESLNTDSSTQKNRFHSSTSTELAGYGFTFRNEDSGEYTEPPESYRIRTEFRPSQEYAAALKQPQLQSYKSSTFRNDYTLSTPKEQQQKSSTTLRNYFVNSLKPPTPGQHVHYGTSHTEKNSERIQLPLPQLPSLPTLTFSSPAPFSLQQRNEQKRYTKEHLPPPRIVISASASVSDASGKRLNYSLGTIGAAQLFKPPPRSYDEYKDEDVALDPFYLDVPKVTISPRKKRSADGGRKRNYADIIKNDEEALDVLKFLFDWYKHEKTNPVRYTTPITTPLDLDGISSINHELAPEVDDEDGLDLIFNTSDSFGKNVKYSFFGNDGASVSHEEERKINKVHEKFTIEHEPNDYFQKNDDYVNDNYEPKTYKEFGDKKYHEETKKNLDDYVDDNIEPIYYKERNEDYSSHVKNEESTPATTEIEYTLTTDSLPTTTTTWHSRRSNKKDKENLDEPHRAKDDYDYLRTVHFYTSTLRPNYETETEFIPTITESPVVTTEEPIQKTAAEEIDDYNRNNIITPFSITTEKSRKRNKGRRGKLKFGDVLNEQTVIRRQKPPEATIHRGGDKPLEDPLTSKSSDQVKRQEPYSEILQSTTKESNPAEDSTTATTTISSFEDLFTESNDNKGEEIFLHLETTTEQFDGYTTTESAIWPKNLKKMIENIETNTKSIVAPKIYKQIITETEETTSTPALSTTTMLSTEENKSTTEDALSTTEAVKENEETTTEDVSSSSTLTNIPESTILPQSTTIGDRYSQIPTTLEQFTSTTEVIDTTTEASTTSTKKSRRRGGKSTSRRPETSGYRHRFSTDQFTRRPKQRKPVVEEEIVRAIIQTDVASSTESLRGSTKRKDFDVLTDYPLRKSVNPTQSERGMVTTPFSQRSSTNRNFFFNCFGKSIDRFYPDLRDCRLFHYCTQGYNKNQLLDLKFVCDLNTFFDDEKLICTKTIPRRCL